MSVIATLETANELMYGKTVLTSEERDVCVKFMPDMANRYLFHQTWDNTWLNLYVYSEVDKEEYDLRREMGY